MVTSQSWNITELLQKQPTVIQNTARSQTIESKPNLFHSAFLYLLNKHMLICCVSTMMQKLY
jgi:hypothetical protein